MIEIIAPGPLTTVQDVGRPGWASVGVPHSGAFDRGAARLANRLVGNDPGAAALEVTLGGLVLRARDAVTVALTGAACPGTDWGVAVSLASGSVLRLGTPPLGLRSYVAVRGGLAVEASLGSRSTDLLSGIGPPRVRAGDRLPVGPPPLASPSGAVAPTGSPRRVLRVSPGPRADWFTEDALDRLIGTTWTVRPESDRIGVRLGGPPLRRARGGELPSEPTRPGAVQVPADGRPIIFGPDAPVTGGYPVIAVVADADLDAAAQLRPGDSLRFTRDITRGSGAGSPTRARRPPPRPES